MISNKYYAGHAGVVAVLVWVVLAVLGGPSNAFDKWAVDVLAAERLAHPLLTHAGIRVSFAGSAPVTLGLTLLGTAFLVWRGRYFHALFLAGLVLSGRLMIDVLKQLIMRPRPDLELHGVAVQSLSFPSSHAANSMIAFVAIALFCAPERHRRMALTVAIAASLAIGATRPLLGVHWPSDVLAGWIFGLLWAVGWWQIAGRSGASRSA